MKNAAMKKQSPKTVIPDIIVRFLPIFPAMSPAGIKATTAATVASIKLLANPPPAMPK